MSTWTSHCNPISMQMLDPICFLLTSLGTLNWLQSRLRRPWKISLAYASVLGLAKFSKIGANLGA